MEARYKTSSNNQLILPLNSKNMKKALYLILVTLVLLASLSSCTKEEIKPKSGGNGSSLQDKF
jgi:hypothetical protein